MYHNTLESKFNGCWEDEGHPSSIPHFLLLPPAVYPHTTSCAAFSVGVESRKGFDSANFTITKTSLRYQLCFQHKSKSQPQSSYCREKELRPKPAWCTTTQRCPNTLTGVECKSFTAWPLTENNWEIRCYNNKYKTNSTNALGNIKHWAGAHLSLVRGWNGIWSRIWNTGN